MQRTFEIYSKIKGRLMINDLNLTLLPPDKFVITKENKKKYRKNNK